MANRQSTVTYRDIPDFVGYRVGNDGSVWSRWKAQGRGEGNGRGRIVVLGNEWRKLKPRSSDGVNGYPGVDLWHDGKPYTRTIHILVLTAFIGPPPFGMECRHVDGNRANNSLGNLKWGTHQENVDDQIRHGTIRRGSRHWNSKLNEVTVRAMRADYATGKIGYRRLAKKYDVTFGAVRSIVLRESWKHVA